MSDFMHSIHKFRYIFANCFFRSIFIIYIDAFYLLDRRMIKIYKWVDIHKQSKKDKCKLNRKFYTLKNLL